jgi:hypothetical protein
LWKHCLTISLPEGWPDTYRHKEMRSTDRPTYSVRFSWSCLAETFQLCPTQLKYTNLRIATETRPIRNKNCVAEYSVPARLGKETKQSPAKAFNCLPLQRKSCSCHTSNESSERPVQIHPFRTWRNRLLGIPVLDEDALSITKISTTLNYFTPRSPCI